MAIKYHSNIRLMDNNILQIGTGGDLKLEHTGTHSYIYNTTGDLVIKNLADDKDIILMSDDGSGGVTSYLSLDGSNALTRFQKNVLFGDNTYIYIGAGFDFHFSHNGTDSLIQNATGDLYIKNGADDKDIIFQSDDGSGGVTDYIRLDGSEAKTIVSKTMEFQDNVKLAVGNSEDLIIDHNATNSRITNYTGNLRIINASDDNDITFECDDGSGGVETYFFLDGSTGHTQFPDAKKLQFGSSNDMFIEHDGSNSYISNSVGTFYIRQTLDDGDLVLTCDDGSGGNTAYLTLDGSNTRTIFNESASFVDGKYLYFGTGLDAHIKHSGSDLVMVNTAGNVTIQNSTDDGDIIFVSDDGSGGTTTYFTIDGGITRNKFHKNLHILDNVYAEFGGNNDLRLVHDGTDSQIDNATGDLIIKNRADDKDVILMSDDGSGSTATYFYLDGSVGFNRFPYPVIVEDSVNFNLGTGQDMQLLHNGSDSVIRNATGDLYIQQNADDKDIIFQSDNGLGGLATYFRLDGSVTNTIFEQNARFLDTIELRLGTSNDLKIYHDGSNSFINQVGTGDLYIRNSTDDKDIIFQSDDGSGGYETYLMLDGAASNIKVYKDMRFADNERAEFGTVGDLRIYHDASNSYIKQQGTGSLIIEQTTDDADIVFQSDDGSGGTTAYITLDGSEEVINLHQNITGFSTEQGYAARHPSHLFVSYSISNISTETTFALGTLTFGSVYTHGFKVTVTSYGGHKVFEYFGYQGNLNRKVYGSYNQDATRFADIDVVVEEVLDGSNQITDVKIGVRNTSASNTDYIFSAQVECMSYGNHTWTDLANDASITDNAVNQTVRPVEIFHGLTVGEDDTGHDVKFFGATSGRYLLWDESDDALEGTDNVRIKLGAAADLQIVHTGSDSYIHNTSNTNLYFKQSGVDKDIIFLADDGSGSETAYITLDGSVTRTIFSQEARFTDGVNLKFGTGGDMMLYHDGSNSYIDHTGTGDLLIRQGQDDKDIKFVCDDGSGGLTAYITLDGSSGYVDINRTMYLDDNVDLRIGTNGDLELSHDGTDSYVSNNNGHLYIRQQADDKDIIFQSDDGSGGTETYFFLDGSTGYTLFPDGKILGFGAAGDLSLQHDGSNSYINANGTGDLIIKQMTDDKDISFQCDDGSGGTTEYFRLDGSVGYMVASKAIRALDSVNLQLGASADFTMQHNGSNTVLQNFTGDLQITQGADDKDIILSSDDGSGGTTAYITLDGSAKEVFTSVPTSIPTRKLGKSGTTDGDYNGDVVYFGSTTGMEVGKIYYLTSSGTWALADANAESTAKGMLAVALGSASDTDGMLIRGFVTLDHDPGSISEPLFLSAANTGQAISTAPAGNGDIVRVIGYCLDSTNGQIYFNPDGTFVEVSA